MMGVCPRTCGRPAIHFPVGTAKNGCFSPASRASFSVPPGTAALLAIADGQIISPSSSVRCMFRQQINYSPFPPPLRVFCHSFTALQLPSIRLPRSCRRRQIQFPEHRKMASFLPSSTLLVTLLLVAFCCVASMVRAQADPRLEDDLFLRNLLLRRYFVDQQTPVLTIGRVPEAGADDQLQLVPEAAVSSFWRQRRTPAERAKLFRLSDQYTPTPCRWKLCASLFKAFRR